MPNPNRDHINYDDALLTDDYLPTFQSRITESQTPLSLTYESRSVVTAMKLLEILQNKTRVVELQLLLRDQSDDDNIRAIIEKVNQLHPSIQSLSIQFKFCSASESLKFIAPLLRLNTSIMHLTLNTFRLSDQSIEEFWRHLSTNDQSRINALSLSNCHYEGDALKTFCDTLKPQTRIKAVCFDSLFNASEQMRDQAGELFARLLENNTSLERFTSSDAVTSDEQLLPIATSLASNTTLNTLTLSHRPTARQPLDTGIIALAEALKTNKSIRHLNLESTSSTHDMPAMSNRAVQVFAAMLCTNNTLESLDLFNTNLPKASSMLVLDALKSNNGLHTLDVNLCNVNENELAAVIGVNTTLRAIICQPIMALPLFIDALRSNPHSALCAISTNMDITSPDDQKALKQLLANNRNRHRSLLSGTSMFHAVTNGESNASASAAARPSI